MVRRTSLLLLLLIFFTGTLPAQPTVSGLTVTQQPNNVLRYAANFTTSQAARGYIEYVWWNGVDSMRAKTGFTDSATTHALTIMGLIQQKTYYYRAIAFDVTGQYPSPWDSFTVATLPTTVTYSQIVSLGGVAGNPLGYPLTNTAVGNPDRYAQIHDRLGRLIWYERMSGIAAANVDGPCQSFTYNPDTRSIFFTDCGRVTEVALDGAILNTINLGSLAPGWMPHHDVYRNAAGNWLILAANVDTIDKSSVGGDPNARVVGPGILEFTPGGTLVWSWSAFDHLDPLTSPGPGGDWVPKFGSQAINWLDANSVMQDGDGNPMLSFGGTSQVVKVARTGSNIVWTCGDNGDIEVLPPDSFRVVHGLRPSRPGYYLSLDNRGLDSLSRVIEWWIDFSYIQARMEISWEHILPAQDFTAMDGNVHRQANGNYMIGSADGHSVTEINSAGSLLWHAVYDSSLHKAFWVEDFYARIHPQLLSDSVVCASDSFIVLEASPAGGFWSGPFVNGDTFNAAAAVSGFFPLTYTWGPEKLEFEIFVDTDVTCGVGMGEARGGELAFSVYPNPFQEQLNVTLDLVRQEELILEVIGMDGRRMLQEELGKRNPGRHEWQLDGAEMASGGVYLVRLRSASGKVGSSVIMKN